MCDAVDDCGDNSDEVRACSRTVECDFEAKNYCGYTLDQWLSRIGAASESGSLHNTGPSFDHTSGLNDGAHTYLVTTQNGALLTTPPLNQSAGSSCLRMYYYLSNNNQIVLHKTSATGDVIATVSGAAEMWQMLEVTLTAGDYPIVFKADIKTLAYVAIDDVTVTAGSCTDTCPHGEFRCQSEALCINDKFRCDGVYNCLDSSDEANCPSTPNPIICSFESPFYCGFRQRNDDDFNWVFNYGYWNTASTTLVGELMATAPAPYARAKIVWPVKVSTASCMRFSYLMNGDDVGSLTVLGNDDILWQQFGKQGVESQNATVNLQSGQSVSFVTQSATTVSLCHVIYQWFLIHWIVLIIIYFRNFFNTLTILHFLQPTYKGKKV